MFSDDYIYVFIGHSFRNILASFFYYVFIGSKDGIAFDAFNNRIGKVANVPGGNKNTFAHNLGAINFNHSIMSHKLSSPQINELVLDTNSIWTVFPEACWSISINFTAWKIKTPF